jgi:hypothetical protein
MRTEAERQAVEDVRDLASCILTMYSFIDGSFRRQYIIPKSSHRKSAEVAAQILLLIRLGT